MLRKKNESTQSESQDKPGHLAQSGASLAANQGVAGSSPGPGTYFRWDLSWNNFYGHSPPSADSKSLGQMSVSGERMCPKYWLTADKA